jgi:hypothetical protein
MNLFIRSCCIAAVMGLLCGCIAASRSELGYGAVVFWLWFAVGTCAAFFIAMLAGAPKADKEIGRATVPVGFTH